jgi:pseudouridine kinase
MTTSHKDFSARNGPTLVIGAAGLDVIAQLDSDLKPGISNPARVRTSFGGVARNVAENLARLGQEVTLITVAGEDSTGTEMLAYTQAAGVDVSAVIHTGKLPTGFYMGALNKKGQLETAVDDMRIISLLTPSAIEKRADLFEAATVLFLDMNLPEDTLETAINLAQEVGLPICADPTSVALAIKLIPYLPQLALITPNSREAGILTGSEFTPSDRQAGLAAARHLVSLGAGITLITLAEFGACYATSETNGQIPAIRTKIIDPTGAGDALAAAVIFALLNEIQLDDAVQLGVSAASLTLRCQGTVLPELSLQKLYDALVI